MGDLVLEAVAATIQHTVRPNDVCARVGGDEFMVLLVDCFRATAEKVAARVLHAVNKLEIQAGDCIIHPGVSVGVGPLPTDANTVTEVLAALSAALRRVKKSGKNAVSF